ncbi:hypothetical protein [Hymenobacter norwichensis]|uniref:hypothetical protein n=1 Tax=Hymenobacter norwichensis TaxID=223903 RepID=UPI0003B3A559|nr:hypothetical protein [Hymenobacter norwichensis]
MLRFPCHTIRFIAATLLVVFLSALLGPALVLAEVVRPRVAEDHLHLPGLPQAHHHHESEKQLQLHLKAGPVKKHHSCQTCTNDDEPPLAALKPLAKLLGELAAPALLALPPVQSYRYQAYQALDRQRPVALVPPDYLKPKIPDLRVFLGSLTI